MLLESMRKNYFFLKETNPLLIKTIYDKSLAELKINRKTYSGYLKNMAI